MTKAIVNSFHIGETEEIELLDKLTKPFTKLIIQIDKDVRLNKLQFTYYLFKQSVNRIRYFRLKQF